MTTSTHRAAPHLVFAVDAVLAALLGVVLAAFASRLHHLVGGGLAPGTLRLVGLGLLPWAAHNAVTAREAPMSLWNPRVQVVGDALWVVASVVLCLEHWSSLTLLGCSLYVSQLVVVAAILAAKLRAIASSRT